MEIIECCPECNGRLEFEISNYEKFEDIRNYIEVYKCSSCKNIFLHYIKIVKKLFKKDKTLFKIRNLYSSIEKERCYKIID